MSRALQSVPVHRVYRRGSRCEEWPAPLLELAKRFEAFRLAHPRGTPISAELREAALAALGNGVAPGDLYRACGISWNQVVIWKARHRFTSTKRRRVAPPDVRVFSVIDEEPARPPETKVSALGPELELRLGPWSVSVRVAGCGPEVRGGACSP